MCFSPQMYRRLTVKEKPNFPNRCQFPWKFHQISLTFSLLKNSLIIPNYPSCQTPWFVKVHKKGKNLLLGTLIISTTQLANPNWASSLTAFQAPHPPPQKRLPMLTVSLKRNCRAAETPDDGGTNNENQCNMAKYYKLHTTNKQPHLPLKGIKARHNLKGWYFVTFPLLFSCSDKHKCSNRQGARQDARSKTVYPHYLRE